MTAKIIKLDEYLTELIDLNKPNIIQSIMVDMGVDEETAESLYHDMTFAQEHQMVDTHLNSELSDEQKLAVSHAILDPIIATRNNQPFGGVDLSEGFNFRRLIANEVARNNIMDWLEENEVVYLIDNNGNFAVKCPDRKTHYKVNRQFEHILNKWDKGPVGKNVDPTVSRKPLADIAHIRNTLTDGLTEEELAEAAQDGSMPVPDASGTAPMFPATKKGDMTDGIPTVYENTEEGAMSVLGDLINPSSTPYIEKLDEETGEWLICDDTAERSYFVDIDKGNFEEVEYIYETVGGRGAGPSRRLGGGGRSSFDPKHGGANIRRDVDLPTKFDHAGIEVPADPLATRSREKAEKFLKVPFDKLMKASTDQEKVALMLKYNIMSSDVPEQHWNNFIQQFDDAREKIQQIAASGGKAGVNEAKNTAEKREKRAKDKLATMRKGQGAAAAMARGTHKKKAGAHDPSKYTRRTKHKVAAQLDEHDISGATGMTAMPSMGVNRLRQLAGLPASSMTVIEERPVEVEKKNEPIVQNGRELHEIDDALNHLDEVFNIYKTLNTEDKKELRYTLVSTIMGDGDRLSESVINLLLNSDNKPSVLLEFDGEGDPLSEEDKAYLETMIVDIKNTMIEDIEELDEESKVSLARVAYLLERLQAQMEQTK